MSVLGSFLLLAGCGSSPGGSDDRTPDPVARDTADLLHPAAYGAECALSPDLPSGPTRLRVGPDGALWLLARSELYRFVREDSVDCALSGDRVWDLGERGPVLDIDVDETGRPVLLFALPGLVRLTPAGELDVACEDVEATSLVVSGDRVYLARGGDHELSWVDLEGAACVPPAAPLALQDTLDGTAADVVGDDLVIDVIRPGGPPGARIDLADGSTSSRFGSGGYGDLTLFGLADLVAVGDDLLVVDSNLWRIGSDGEIEEAWSVEDLIGPGRSGFVSVATREGQPTYLLEATQVGGAATSASVWSVESEALR